MNEQETNKEMSEQGDDKRGSDSDRRQSVLDRRTGLDRRQKTQEVSLDRRSGIDRREEKVGAVGDRRTGLERRRGPGIRREEDRRAAEEGEMTDEQFEFVMAVDDYKRKNKRPFPTLTEVLEIIKELGYKKIS